MTTYVMYQIVINKANDHKVYQMVRKNIKVFNSKALQNVPKFWVLVRKHTYRLATRTQSRIEMSASFLACYCCVVQHREARVFTHAKKHVSRFPRFVARDVV
jgi:hypothetical protein